MGCWNETCAISNLPILENEESVMILLQNNKYKNMNDTCCIYPDNIWLPFGFPIFGRYDDYGGLNNTTTHPWNKELVDIINETTNTIQTDIGKHKDFPNVMFIHKKLYDIIIDAIGKRIPVNHTKTYKECLYESIIEQLNNHSLYSIHQNPFEYGRQQHDTAANFFLDKYKNCNNKEEKENAIQNLIDCKLLSLALLLLRKGYLTQSGTGSQNCETSLHMLVAKFTIEHAQKMMFCDDDDTPMQPNDGYEEPIHYHYTSF